MNYYVVKKIRTAHDKDISCPGGIFVDIRIQKITVNNKTNYEITWMKNDIWQVIKSSIKAGHVPRPKIKERYI